MTIEDDTLRAGLRVLMVFPTEIPDYATDPVVQRRIGKVIAENAARVRLWPIGEWFNPGENRVEYQ